MKNLILSIVLIAIFSLSAFALTENNGNEIATDENVTVANLEVNTFCKLITKGDIEAVKSMIKAGTDVNEKSVGMTPLMYAARYNKTEIVKLLIAKGANLKTKSDRGYTALEYAEMSKAHDTYKIISETINARMAI